jgi:hypothetical protein
MTTSYHHRQFSIPAVISGVVLSTPFVAVLLIVLSQPMRQPPLAVVGVLCLALVLVIAIHCVVSSLTIEVDGRELRWHFGPGVWRKRVALDAIALTATVRLPWSYGIGIKSIPGGWAYLVAPGQGVEIVTGAGRILLGTDDPAGLAEAIGRTRTKRA